MTWRYETRSINEVHNMLKRYNNDHPDYDVLKVIAKKALEVAKMFKDGGMNEEFIVKYLNDQLPCDALCKFGLTASVLSPSDVPLMERIYSYSHNQWLNTLCRTKLQWTWEVPKQELQETQRIKLQKLLDTYHDLQRLALSYDFE